MNFAALDLNLLRVFDAMAIELNTTRTGERVGLSQPAVSSALGRLRQILGDELFVREGNRMVPTERALALREPIRQALRQMEDALAAVARFDPASATQTFRISGSDYFSILLMPPLTAAVMPQAPGVTLQMVDHPSSEAVRLLGEGAIDLAVVPVEGSRPTIVDARLEVPDWVCSRKLLESFVVSVVPKRHPVLEKAGIKPGHRIPRRGVLRHPAGADVDGRQQDRHHRSGAGRARPAAPHRAHRAALPGGGAGDRRVRPARQSADPFRAARSRRRSASSSTCRPTTRRSPT